MNHNLDVPDCRKLFLPLHSELMGLLEGLKPDDWNIPAVKRWSVKDVVAHILDTDLRRLSFQRDGLRQIVPAHPVTSYRDLVEFLNGLNHVWVEAARRISPRLLVEIMEQTGKQVAEFFSGLDLEAESFWSVGWAGESRSTNRMDLAREYTEKWHHQQQIRDAVGAAPLTGREWLYPVLQTFMLVMPQHFRETAATDGTRLSIEIAGAAGGNWTLIYKQGWTLTDEVFESGNRVELTDDVAWRLFTNSLSVEEALERVQIFGDADLGRQFLTARAIMV